MKLLYQNEHLACRNYSRPNDGIFEKLLLKEDDSIEKNISEANIMFVVKGNMSIDNNGQHQNIGKGDIILLPPATQIIIKASEASEVIVFRITSTIHLCNIQPLDNLLSTNTLERPSVSLTANERIWSFITLLSECMDDGLRCKCFAEIKSKEIFYYFRAYYTKESLKAFFAPLLTDDYEFSVFVLQNHKRIKTVQQFAEEAGYSLSIFERKFKKIFRESAYQWMTKQKSKAIYNDLVNTNRTLLDIADEYDFSSLSQLCDFCKRVLGKSPSKIRDSRKCKHDFTEFVNK